MYAIVKLSTAPCSKLMDIYYFNNKQKTWILELLSAFLFKFELIKYFNYYIALVKNIYLYSVWAKKTQCDTLRSPHSVKIWVTSHWLLIKELDLTYNDGFWFDSGLREYSQARIERKTIAICQIVIYILLTLL